MLRAPSLARTRGLPATSLSSVSNCLVYIPPRGRSFHTPSLLSHQRIISRTPSFTSRGRLIGTLKSLTSQGVFSRSMSSQPLASELSEDAMRPDQLTDLNPYHKVADETLEHYQEELEVLQDAVGDDFDIDYAMGVLTIKLPQGTYVLNKQAPNRQVWYSSPVTGPKRYYYHVKQNLWLNTRDNTPLSKQLQKELKELVGVEVKLTDPKH